jgi:hypothetical protein
LSKAKKCSYIPKAYSMEAPLPARVREYTQSRKFLRVKLLWKTALTQNVMYMRQTA